MINIKPYLGDKEFYKQTVKISVPIALQNLITVGVNLADNVMVGTLGETVMSACSQACQFIIFYQICCMGIGMGASVMVSRFWGMKDIPSLKKSITIMLRFTIIMGLIFTLLDAFIPRTIMQLYTPDTPVIEQGILYLNWSVPTFLLTGLIITCSIVLRCIGQGRVPLIGSIFAFFINIFANWVFIFGHLGAPEMGIEGAALGTLISRIFEFVFNFGYFILIEKKVAYRIQDLFKKCGDLLKTYIKISLPVLISDMIYALGNSVVAMVMGRIGKNFVAANSITVVTQQLTTTLIQGISQAGCIITGHNIGAGKTEDAKKHAWTFLFLGFFLGAIGGIIIILIGDFIISFYNITEESRQIASSLMKAIGVIVIFQSSNNIITKGVLRGGGDTKVLMLADNIFMWAAAIPLGYLAGITLELPAFWIYFAIKIDQFLKAFWCILRIKSGRWIKAINTES